MRSVLLSSAALLVLASAAFAQTAAPETVVVYGTLPSSGMGLPPGKVPGTLQSLSADSITAGHGASVLDSLGANTAGISLTDTQGNSMAQNLRFHGFEASPLQGTPQGVAVYQNGVRLNEAFGDTVNWDEIPQAAIARMDMWSNNPVFGLNALGGAVNLVMKSGFSFQGADASLQGGSYGHGQAGAEYGEADGNSAFYAALEGIHDSGWRLHSPSDLGRLYADYGWRFGDSEVHVAAAGSQSSLGVIGPTPVEMAAQDSASVYTWPQITQNRVASLALNGKTSLADHWQLEAGAYVRAIRQRHTDGNGGDFESCSSRSSFGGDLCLQDDAFGTPAGGKTTAFRDQFTILTQAGQPATFKSGVNYGTIDRSFTDAVTDGVTLQATSNGALGGFANYFTAGGSLDHSAIAFRSASTLARISTDLNVAPDSALAGSGAIIHAKGNIGYAPTDLAGTTDYYGLYAVDALDLSDALTVTAGLRINSAAIATRDRSGVAAELTGTHGYAHFNPLAGATYKIADWISAFAGYSQSNRIPTPLELDCASPTQPCLLEGALVADPPLKQVVAQSFEAGLRGRTKGLTWSASLFRSDATNDIVSLASAIQGRGYFTNVPGTRRQGADLSTQYAAEDWSTHFAYSYLDATYRFTGALASPNNPEADANGNVAVTPGRHIPLNPAHQLRLGGDWTVMTNLSVGGDLVVIGSEYFDGDGANQNRKLAGRADVNLRASYDFGADWQIFGVINNVLNHHDAVYGAYFSPDDGSQLTGTKLSDPRSVTLEQPISVQLGIKAKF